MAEDECPLLTEVKTEPPDVDDVKYILERSTKMLADDVDSNDLEMSRNVWNGKVEGNSKLELSGPDQEQENIYEIGLVKEDNVDDLSPGYSEDIKIAGNVINQKQTPRPLHVKHQKPASVVRSGSINDFDQKSSSPGLSQASTTPNHLLTALNIIITSQSS
ncbi:hypothetical protein LSH36_688g00006, partial [Paralvinella palmiformis]